MQGGVVVKGSHGCLSVWECLFDHHHSYGAMKKNLEADQIQVHESILQDPESGEGQDTTNNLFLSYDFLA